MTEIELLRVLESQGVKIRVDGEDLVLSNHHGKITEGLLEAIKAQKPELIRLLLAKPANDVLAPCPECGDTERWPTTKGPVCPTCWLAARAPKAEPVTWLVERSLTPSR